MDLHTPRFTTRQVANLAGFSPSTLRNWTGVMFGVQPGDSVMAGEKGEATRFNLRMVYQAAIARRLIEAGVDREVAFGAGARFAHTGHGGRYPGQLFASGATVLVYVPGVGDGADSVRLVNTPNLRTIELGDLFFGGTGGCVAVLVNTVVLEINERIEATIPK